MDYLNEIIDNIEILSYLMYVEISNYGTTLFDYLLRFLVVPLQTFRCHYGVWLRFYKECSYNQSITRN